MRILAWVVLAVGYLTGYMITAVTATHRFARSPYCHSYDRHARSWCTQNHRGRDSQGRRCWRPDEDHRLILEHAVAGSAVAVLWPLTLMPFIVLALAGRGRSRLLSADELATLEQEAGL